jgi:hypothetical protein
VQTRAKKTKGKHGKSQRQQPANLSAALLSLSRIVRTHGLL